MSRRTTIGLGVVAIAMALFIALFERGTLTTGELEARRGRVVQSFVRPRVSEVELRRGDDRIVLHRDREEDLDAFEVGHWSLTQPIESDADQDAVDQLLSSIEWLDARRSLRGIGEDDRERFGLTSPRASVRFTAADRDVTITLGGDDPRGEGVYVAVGDRPGEAFVVGRDFVEALEHDVDHFRRKELFGAFRSARASAIELRSPTSEARLERADGRWMVREPFEALARTQAVESLFEVIHEVRAARFLDEEADDLGRFGLDQPSREIVIRRAAPREEGDAGDEDDEADETTPLRLRVGGACPGHEGELTAIAGDDGPVVCVAAESIAALDVEADRLRENRLVSMRDDELERASVDASSDFELRRRDEAWQIARGDDDAVAADQDAIADWMRALRAQEASAYEPATDAALRARGLATPRATITLHRSDADRRETLRLGSADADGVWVRRGEEPQIARFPLAAAELLAPSAIRFRERALVRENEPSLRRLRVARSGGADEIVERGSGGDWRVTEPVAVAADRVVARDVARALARLSALRFAAERAAPEHGLERPRIVVSARFEGFPPEAGADEEDDDGDDHAHEGAEEPAPREIVLRIGAATEDGAYARLGDDPAVVVIPRELVEDLEGPLASRDLLATDTGAVESLAIVRGGERIELRREGEGWTAGQGAADAARTTLVLDRLASMRAIGTTSYGAPPAAAGAASPTLVLEVQRRTGAPERYEIRVGAPGAARADGTEWYHARRSDLPIGYQLGATVVRAFLDYQP